MDKKRQQISSIIDSAGIILLGLFSLGYCLFSKKFAELHINLPFLDFPVFVGEILLFICLALLITKWLYNRQVYNVWHYLLLCYFGFVLAKALWGYFEWGPLALRHSALFYYPLFAIFGYYFYKWNFFNNDKNILCLIALLIFIIRFTSFYEYFLFTCFILTFILIVAYPYRIARYIFTFILLIFTPYKYIYTSRTFLLGNIAAGIFIVITLLIILKLKKRYKIILFGFFVVVTSLGVLKMAESPRVKSLFNISKTIDLYNLYNEEISAKENEFEMQRIKEVGLYKPEVLVFEKSNIRMSKQARIAEAQVKMTEAQVKIEEAQTKMKEARIAVIEEAKVSEAIIEAQNKMKEIQAKIKKILTELENMKMKIEQVIHVSDIERPYHTALFRIYIWQDILDEYMGKKPFLGFDFGKPFRSKRLEILDWAMEDWYEIGWVTAHNSYLEIIYRAGVAGVLFILIIICLSFKLIKEAIREKSITGVLLCGILINWLAAANFLVILELPYNAIPFWSLFGMTFAYLNNRKDGRVLFF